MCVPNPEPTGRISVVNIRKVVKDHDGHPEKALTLKSYSVLIHSLRDNGTRSSITYEKKVHAFLLKDQDHTTRRATKEELVNNEGL